MKTLYETLTYEEVQDAISERKGIVFNVQIPHTSIDTPEAIKHISKSITPISFPPIPYKLKELIIAEGLTDKTTERGRWESIALKTYINNGQILYERAQDNFYRVEILFPDVVHVV
jgi:hypothetical protein